MLDFNYYNNSVFTHVLVSHSQLETHSVSLLNRAAIIAVCFYTNSILFFFLTVYSWKWLFSSISSAINSSILKLVFTMEFVTLAIVYKKR